MATSSHPPAKPLGRPRAFCTEDALDAATLVFRRQGYDGASLSDLTSAMGINRPSCYAAFGDKEALFLQVLERYTAQLRALYRSACKQPTAHAAARFLLDGTIEIATSGQGDPCLLNLGSISETRLANLLLASRQKLDQSLERRFLRARRTGDLAPQADPAALAAIVSLTLRGISTQALEGASRRRLHALAETVLQLFPTKP